MHVGLTVEWEGRERQGGNKGWRRRVDSVLYAFLLMSYSC